LRAVNNPENESDGKRDLPFSKELFIEKDDFMEDPPKKFFRLSPGREVRLRYAYFITCEKLVKDSEGNIIELHCTYDPDTKGGNSPDGRKVKATLHWVSASDSIDAEIRKYDRLFQIPEPDKEDNFMDAINPSSLEVLSNCKLEPSLKEVKVGESIQFERLGYFCKDSDSDDTPIFNQTVPLRDSWGKIDKQRLSGN
jgi:glutaminyl-tRNA synthetase